jgi:nucleotide-binding universal stress UspA family protein
MVQKILVAIEKSENSKEVFSQALSLAKDTGAVLHLVHVLSTDEKGSPIAPPLPYPAIDHRVLEDYQKRWKIFEAEGLELLSSLNKDAISVGVKTEITQVFGSPGKKVIDIAKDWNADLIVVGRRGRSEITELVLGSVSSYIVHASHKSVLVVQN